MDREHVKVVKGREVNGKMNENHYFHINIYKLRDMGQTVSRLTFPYICVNLLN